MFIRTLATTTGAAAVCLGLVAIASFTPAEAQTLTSAPLQLTPAPHAHHPRAKKTKSADDTAMNSPSSSQDRPSDNVIRGQDTVAMVALLPWWRGTPAEAERVKAKQNDSLAMMASRAFLGAAEAAQPAEITQAAAAQTSTQAASTEAALPDKARDSDQATDFALADPNDLNAIDEAAESAADSTPPPEPGRSWFNSLIALLGGALAAASTARYLFV